MVTVRFKLIHEHARLPAYQTAGAAGADIYSVEEVQLSRVRVTHVRSGLVPEIPAGWVGLICPRGSQSKASIHVALGVIDSDYRGELHVQMILLGCSYHRVRVGDRIGQLLILPAPQAQFVAADDLTPTARGAGAFGSTGR